ncbi:acyl-CoA thioesterase [Chloroflexota bacterium]
MARVTLEEQPSYTFQHTLSIRFTDINLAAHLATESLVGMLQEARAQALRQMGFDSLDLGVDNVGFAIADLVVNFRREGAVFEPLKIESHFGDIGQRSLRLYHRVTCDSELLALAETGLVCFDYRARQSVPIPDRFLSELEKHQILMENLP